MATDAGLIVAATSSLGAFARLRAAITRPAVRWALRTDLVRRWVLARRAEDVTAGLEPDTAIVVELAALTGQREAVSGTPEAERRKLLENVAVSEDPIAGAFTVTDRAAEGAAGPVAARIYEPAGLARPSPGLVYVHGGGWVTGDLETHDTFCRRLALIGRIRVVAVAPRLAPEHPFPAAADDSIAAFRWVAEHSSELGLDPERLGIGGESAGGNLSALVGLETRSDPIRPRLTVLIYPALDATWSMPSIQAKGTGYLLTERSLEWYAGHYLGDDRARRLHPRVSMLRRDDLRGAPRALVAVAGFDPLFDEGVAYAKKLGEVGTEVELLTYASLIHGFILMTGLSPESRRASDEIARRTGEILRDR